MAESKKCETTAIAITVPHADCPTADEWMMLGAAGQRQTHWCDFAAAPAARQLALEFHRRGKSLTTETFVSSTPRFICDLNRPTCQADLSPSIVRRLDKWFGLQGRAKPGDWNKELEKEMKHFRDPIRAWMDQQGAKCSWLVDVHSFRHGTDVFDGQDRDLVLLDNRPDGPDTYYPYTVALAKFLQTNQIDAAVLKGATTGKGTDLSVPAGHSLCGDQGRNENNVWAAKELGVHGVFLLEFNERLDGDERAWVCRLIAEWFLQNGQI